MKSCKYLKGILMACCLGLLGFQTVAAQEARPVYLVRQPGQNDVWTMNMGVQTEALRLYVPTAFERKGKTINLSSDTPRVSFSSGRETVITRSADGILVRYDVSIEGAPRLPRADRSLTIRFTLAELAAAGTGESGAPGSYAIRQAILAGPYAKGRAWVRRVDYKDNRFVVVVGLKR
ncbi:MAG: hypothetical protein AB7T74_13515 [Clostridia bacterium]